MKDAIPETDYTETCDRLLKQYKAILTDDVVAREFGDLERFKEEWEVWRDYCLSRSAYINGDIDGSTTRH